ncbi:MAG: FkbM family methyltransferase [Limisphaerales bacterium]
MNLRQLIKFLFWRDTTHNGEFAIFRRLITPNFPQVVVDVGANDGFKGSNAYPFVARGWRAVLIEPHPVVFDRLQRRFACDPKVTCLHLACSDMVGELPLYLGTDGDAPSLSTLCADDNPEFRRGRPMDKMIMVKVDTLSNVLATLQIPCDIGLLTVDAEGMDYEVLRGLDFSRWWPRIIITEDYAPKEAQKADWLAKNGYHLHARVYGNTIWTPAN